MVSQAALLLGSSDPADPLVPEMVMAVKDIVLEPWAGHNLRK